MKMPVDISKTVLETERLILRSWNERDIDDFFEYASVDGVGQAAGWQPHKNKQESMDILKMFIGEKKTFAIVFKDNDKVIGSLGLEEPIQDLGEPYTSRKGRQIGYVLSKDYWGQGLMTEAVKCVIEYCFESLECEFLQISHALNNIRSRRVIEKCGFNFLKNCELSTPIGEVRMSKIYVMDFDDYLKSKK